MVNLKIQQELKAVLEEEDQKLGIKSIFDKLREIMAVEDQSKEVIEETLR